MNALRLERLVWSAALGYWLGVPLALRLTPDSSGPVSLVLAALGFLAAASFVARALAFAASETERPGELTAHLAAVLGVSLAFYVTLDAVGVDGAINTFVSIVVGLSAGGRVRDWVAARRRDDGPLSS